MRFQIGQTVGGYEFLDVLDASQDGREYKVRNVLAQRLERLKVFPKELQDDRERVERFLREIKIHAHLAHPNIAAFYNATQVDGQLVMTTELLEGVTLNQCLESGPIAWQEAAGYVTQALSALGHAHEQGVVHRMITPASLTILPEGTVKLTGFDLAKAATDPQLTQAGVVMGSLEYMSPEQVRGSLLLDSRSDIYSLGAVLYAAVTGKPPFDSKVQFEIMLAHVNTPPTPPSAANPELPPELDRIILRALEKDPTRRFQTAREFRQSLESLVPAGEAPRQEAVLLPPLAKPATSPDPKPLPTEAAPAAEEKVRAGLSPELIALGAFTFVIVAVAFFAFLAVVKL